MFNFLKKIKEKQENKDKELVDKFANVEFEKNDALAMFIAAFVTFVPIIVIILAAIFGVIYFFFMR